MDAHHHGTLPHQARPEPVPSDDVDRLSVAIAAAPGLLTPAKRKAPDPNGGHHG